MRSKWMVVLVATLIAGCGDSGVDISGMYMTTSLTADSSGCGPGTVDTSPPPFFNVTTQELLGTSYYTVASCTSNNPSTCSGGGLTLPLTQQIPDGWRGQVSVAAGDANRCSLTFTELTATLSGGVLRYEEKVFAAAAISVPECSTKEAAKRGATMPCKSYSLMLGSKLNP